MKPEELKKLVEKSLSNSKAINVITVNLQGKTSIADYMVVATGTSSRHVSSIAENLVKDLREKDIKGLEPEGKESGEWVLVDLLDVIVHVFQPEFREKYDLEKMWQMPADKIFEKKEKKAKKAEKPKADKKPAKKAPVRKPAKKPAAKKPAAKAKAPAKKKSK